MDAALSDLACISFWCPGDNRHKWDVEAGWVDAAVDTQHSGLIHVTLHCIVTAFDMTGVSERYANQDLLQDGLMIQQLTKSKLRFGRVSRKSRLLAVTLASSPCTVLYLLCS